MAQQSIAGKFITVGAATTYSTALPAESAIAATTTAPATDTSTGRFVFPSLVTDQTDPTNPIHRLLGFAMTDAANETANALVIGWRVLSDADGDDAQYIPSLMFKCDDVTAGALVGAGSTRITSSHRFADTITISSSNVGGAEALGTSAGDAILLVKFDQSGYDMIEVRCSVNGETAASIVPFLGAM